MTTANPKPNTGASKLVASVREGLEEVHAQATMDNDSWDKFLTAIIAFDQLRQRYALLAEENEKLKGVLGIFIYNNWITVHKGQRLNQLTISLNDEQLEQFRNLLESKSPTPLA